MSAIGRRYSTTTHKIITTGQTGHPNGLGHFAEWNNTEIWTQRRNELLDTSPKLDISPKVLIGRNAENGHNAEIGNWTYHRKWTQRRNAKTDATWIGNRASHPKL
ncbi:hypothetical protein FQR65_LT13735 [Abscondita terminalis]|nr:hypothetical protein FQR65_LT13735 [Abscondita terminalis]